MKCYDKKINIIYRQNLVEGIIEAIQQVQRYYQYLSVPTPIILSCAVVNGKGFTIPTDHYVYGEIDRENLIIPDSIINDLATPASQIAKPILDSLWNAVGYISCPLYSDDGEYKSSSL